MEDRYKEQFSTLAHQISQPLMVINTYVTGCLLRLEHDTYSKNDLITVLKIIAEQVSSVKNIMNEFQRAT